MVTPVRNGSRRRRGRDSVHTDKAHVQTGDADIRYETPRRAPEAARPRPGASTGHVRHPAMPRQRLGGEECRSDTGSSKMSRRKRRYDRDAPLCRHAKADAMYRRPYTIAHPYIHCQLLRFCYKSHSIIALIFHLL